MPKLVKKDIQFNSADGKNAVAGYIYKSDAVPVRAVVQISHGMCEYIARYEELAEYLAAAGVALAGNDHIGHGSSAVREEDYGYFTAKGGRRYALKDLKTMNGFIREEFPGVPVVLLGHSMGSFFARKYAANWPETIDGLIICGTGGPNPAAGMGIALTSLLAKIKGGRYRSEFIHKLAFGAYLKRIENPATSYDWISRDTDIVAIYNTDPKCTFRFTVNGFRELFSALQDVSSPHWAQSLPKGLPVYVIAGDADPVGGYGKGVKTVYGWLQEAGIETLELKLYEGMRHEILNEVGREAVYADVLAFVDRAARGG